MKRKKKQPSNEKLQKLKEERNKIGKKYGMFSPEFSEINKRVREFIDEG